MLDGNDRSAVAEKTTVTRTVDLGNVQVVLERTERVTIHQNVDGIDPTGVRQLEESKDVKRGVEKDANGREVGVSKADKYAAKRDVNEEKGKRNIDGKDPANVKRAEERKDLKDGAEKEAKRGKDGNRKVDKYVSKQGDHEGKANRAIDEIKPTNVRQVEDRKGVRDGVETDAEVGEDKYGQKQNDDAEKGQKNDHTVREDRSLKEGISDQRDNYQIAESRRDEENYVDRSESELKKEKDDKDGVSDGEIKIDRKVDSNGISGSRRELKSKNDRREEYDIVCKRCGGGAADINDWLDGCVNCGATIDIAGDVTSAVGVGSREKDSKDENDGKESRNGSGHGSGIMTNSKRGVDGSVRELQDVEYEIKSKYENQDKIVGRKDSRIEVVKDDAKIAQMTESSGVRSGGVGKGRKSSVRDTSKVECEMKPSNENQDKVLGKNDSRKDVVSGNENIPQLTERNDVVRSDKVGNYGSKESKPVDVQSENPPDITDTKQNAAQSKSQKQPKIVCLIVAVNQTISLCFPARLFVCQFHAVNEQADAVTVVSSPRYTGGLLGANIGLRLSTGF